MLLIFLNPTRLNKIIVLLTQHELSEDPKDIVANYAMRLASDFSLSSQSFGVFYLISHGIIKLFLILMLWNKKTWAYPLTIFSLLLFIFYQLYRCAIKYSIWLNVLSIFDLAIVILTLIEYRLIKHHIN
ncbi:DUF2127 domain-containing protein [Clostridium acetobutylicum]|uniref:DUF2127 domain-containing protein n=1 Tax=Clostridium acetobutylicum TaxID=1488 RepID=UPI0028529359|nr:DUF2127 domain-containing protein [Clostridium acetobutylicum]